MEPLCERCKKQEAKPKEKYCKECRKIVLAEMKEAGYLSSVHTGHAGYGRTSEMKEKVYETKHGTWHG